MRTDVSAGEPGLRVVGDRAGDRVGGRAHADLGSEGGTSNDRSAR